LIETRNQIAKRILQNGIKKKTIINSLENGNIAELKTESGISNEEFNLLINKMEEIKLLITTQQLRLVLIQKKLELTVAG
jgi:hypothetical protein